MSRKKVTRTLPPLDGMFRGFPGFPPSENHTAALEQTLRDVILRNRQVHEQPFYAIREVASFFRINYRTVARVYSRLEEGGLLRLVRGSCTMMRGKVLTPTHPVLGVVGVPVLLPSFIFGTAGRAFYSGLEKELRKRHFVADFIFYREDEESHPDLAERFREHNLDILFWMSPDASAALTVLAMLDSGVAVVIVNDGKGHFEREQYRLDLEGAYGEALADWQSRGVRHIELWTPDSRQDHHILQSMERVLSNGKLPFATHRLRDTDVPARLKAISRKQDTGVILVSHQWYDGLCAQYPESMKRLFMNHRVLLPQGPLYHPGFTGHDIFADTIQLDHHIMASRIASDIASQRTDSGKLLATFRTRYHPHTNLGAVKRDI